MAPLFPGMDPFLEGAVWPDFHHDLATRIKDQLLPQIIPDYLVRIAVYLVEDAHPEEEIGILYPDVEVLHKLKEFKEPEAAYGTTVPITPSTLTIPAVKPIESRIPVIEIVDKDKNRLVTAIEIVSPVNKRNPGFGQYLEKKQKLIRGGIHFLEIDLIRRGKRTYENPLFRDYHYQICLTRANNGQTDIWALKIRDKLPVVPIPLRAPDPDAKLNLQAAFEEVYEKSFYRLTLPYHETPPPPNFDEETLGWITEKLANK